MISEYLKYYNLEDYLLTEVRDNFRKKGYLSTFEFFSIIIWKANRSKSKIAKKLRGENKNSNSRVKELSSKIYKAETPEAKLRILFDEFNIPLATSSAVLSVLYPDVFTVYDYRVCEEYPEFSDLKNKTKFESIWPEYEKYTKAVSESAGNNVSLRDKDRALWGKSFYNQLKKDIKDGFEVRNK